MSGQCEMLARGVKRTPSHQPTTTALEKLNLLPFWSGGDEAWDTRAKGPRLALHRAKNRAPMWTIRTERPAYNVAHAMVLHAAVREPQRPRLPLKIPIPLGDPTGAAPMPAAGLI